MSTNCASSVPPSSRSFPPASMFAPEKVVSVTPDETRTVIVAGLVAETFNSQIVELDDTTASFAPAALRTLAIQRTSGVPAALQLLVVDHVPLAAALVQLCAEVTGSLM